MATCSACTKELGAIEATQFSVCLPCTVARHKAVVKKKCCCRKVDKRPRTIDVKFRGWVACDRCLGTIKQLR
jgi:hypothetical protein